MKLFLSLLVFYCFSCLASENDDFVFCRNGDFPTYKGNFSLGVMNKSSKTFADTCIDRHGNLKCAEGDQLSKGDEIVISKSMNGFLCYWKDDNNVNWVKSKDVTLKKNVERNITKESIVGTWAFGESMIKIIHREGSKYYLTGDSYWYGGRGNLHMGELDSESEVVKGILKWKDEDGCSGTIKRLADKIIIHDNSNCGGVNVSFDGVYLK